MNIKRWHALVIALCTASTLHGQSVGINATGANPEASSILDVSSTTKGFLAPRMTASQRLAILSPAVGLTVFQTDGESGYWVYDTVWKPISQPDLSSYATLSAVADSTAQIRSVIPSAANFATKEAVDAHTAAIAINTSKVGITPEQASAITVNTAKVGITTTQADAITANTAKVGITTAQADAITTNTAKVGITTAQADAITANTAKVGITSDQANAITVNTAKTGITPEQASAITVNTAKVGITTVQADAITANTAGLALKAPIASPVFTGTVTAPTLVSGDVTYPNTKGTADQVLKMTSDAGGLEWGTVAGGGGLTNFTESNYGDGTTFQYGTKLTPNSEQADVDFVIQPKGTGAILAIQPDGAVTGGNKRGPWAVDLQTYRDSADRVASGPASTVSGGAANTASGLASTVSGGSENIASNEKSTVSGGGENTASGGYSMVSGGESNTASGYKSVVSGGGYNTASRNYSTIFGGQGNTASADYSTVSGGESNTASGDHSFAAGIVNTAQSYGETVLGLYATVGAGDSTTRVDSDRLFVIGNGTGPNFRSNALTLLKNGNMTVAGALTTGAVTYPIAYGTSNQLLKMNAGGTALEWGTAGALTNFTESSYGDGTTINYGTKLLAKNDAQANVDFVIQPKGTGAILAQEPDGAATGGNKRSVYAVDLQTQRNNATQVASGIGSTVSGGVGNTASGDLSTASGGLSNTASGELSFAAGTNNTAPSYGETVFGLYATSYTPAADGATQANATDRLFVIGNGTGTGARSNALTLLKNGNMTIAGALTTGAVTYPIAYGTSNQLLKMNAGGTALEWGTAGALTNFTESSYGDGTTINYGTKLLAKNDAQANVDFVIQPKGTGAILAQEPDGTVAGGDKRGDNAVDLQIVRDAPDQVASGPLSTVSGGGENTASGDMSTISGGYDNIASTSFSTVSGGNDNKAIGDISTVSGGADNTASGTFSTVSGGTHNTASGTHSFTAGRENTAQSFGEIVLGIWATVGGGDAEARVDGDRLFVIGNGVDGINRSNALTLLKNGNTTIGGSLTINGNGTNTSSSFPTTRGTSGQVLTTNGSGTLSWGTVGLTNFTESNYLYSGKTGTRLIATNAAANVDFVIQPKGTGAILAQQPDGTVAGGSNRGAKAVDLQANRDNATKVASGNYSTVSGGASNTASNEYAVVSGGAGNTASGTRSSVSGGSGNTASGSNAAVSGGAGNIASGYYSLAAGLSNTAQSYSETVLGLYATVGAGMAEFSVNTDRLFVIGNGVDGNNRSNALTLLKNGNMTLAGSLTTGTVTYPNTNGTNGYVLTTNGAGTASWTAPASPVIADGSITSAKILDGTVVTADIANNAVDGTKINLTGNAVGDLMYYNGTDWTRIPAGTSGKVLQSNGTNAPTWETPAGGTTSSIVHNGVLSGTTAQENTFNATGGNEVFQQTIVSAGLYIVNAEVRVMQGGASISAHLLNSGVEINSVQSVSSTDDVTIANISQVVTIAAGDDLTIKVSQYSTSGTTVTGRIVITKLP